MLSDGNYALLRTKRSADADMAARMMRIVVGVPVAGSVSVSSGFVIDPDADPDCVMVGFAAPEPAITALGLDGALSDAPLRVTGTENSRIESIPALIVISVVERADVIVRTYDAPAVRAIEVLTVAIFAVVDPVMDEIRTLSLVA